MGSRGSLRTVHGVINMHGKVGLSDLTDEELLMFEKAKLLGSTEKDFLTAIEARRSNKERQRLIDSVPRQRKERIAAALKLEEIDTEALERMANELVRKFAILMSHTDTHGTLIFKQIAASEVILTIWSVLNDKYGRLDEDTWVIVLEAAHLTPNVLPVLLEECSRQLNATS